MHSRVCSRCAIRRAHDTAGGGLILTFTELVLPGNGGRDLHFQRSYNSKNGQWTFGIAGIVLRVGDGYWPDSVQSDPGPTFFTVDGGEHRAATPLNWISGNLVESRRVMMTDRFWKYDRASRALWRTDGSVSTYDSQGRLQQVNTAFDRVARRRGGTRESTRSPEVGRGKAGGIVPVREQDHRA